MQTLVRSASLTDYLEVACSVGLNPSRMLARVGLSRRSLQNPDLKVPEDAVRELLESSAAAAGVEDFGLRMAERRTLSNFGPLALLLRDQPTIRQAIEAWKLYSKVHTESVSVRIDENDGIAIISMVRSIESFSPKRQGVEMTVGVLYRAMRQFLGDGWRPRVCFVHSAPRNLDTHRRVFGSKVEFNCDFNGIICCTSDLDTPIPAADPAMARYAQQYVDSIKPSEGSFVDRVREQVAMLLASGGCRMERIAEQMGVDRKTVHRHLAEEGTTFSAIVDAVRTELANRYIANRERPLSVVAEMLGFSHSSAFSRWFKKRFGRSVSAWRATNHVKL